MSEYYSTIENDGYRWIARTYSAEATAPIFEQRCLTEWGAKRDLHGMKTIYNDVWDAHLLEPVLARLTGRSQSTLSRHARQADAA